MLLFLNEFEKGQILRLFWFDGNKFWEINKWNETNNT